MYTLYRFIVKYIRFCNSAFLQLSLMLILHKFTNRRLLNIKTFCYAKSHKNQWFLVLPHQKPCIWRCVQSHVYGIALFAPTRCAEKQRINVSAAGASGRSEECSSDRNTSIVFANCWKHSRLLYSLWTATRSWWATARNSRHRQNSRCCWHGFVCPAIVYGLRLPLL